MGAGNIRFVDLKRQYQSLKEDIDGAVNNVLSSGRYVGGEEVTKFEREFSDYIGTKYGFGVGSGSDALIIALQSLGIKKGDKVATSPFTFVSTADAILHVGASPVFIDIDPATLTMDPHELRSKMSNDIKAVIPIHLYGAPVRMAEIMEISNNYGIPVVEDAAQAHGAMINKRKIGSFGQISCFSFYPAKNLGAAGDGGFVATNDPEIADRIKLLREYGQREKYRHDLLGWNSRLDPLQATILSVKLKHLDNWNVSRVKIASKYREALHGIDKIAFQEIPENSSSVYHIFAIFTRDREILKTHLNKQGIETGIHYPVPVHLQKYYMDISTWDRKCLSKSEVAADTELSLPMFPELTQDEIDYIVKEVQGFYKRR